MTFKIFTGVERGLHVARAGCCDVCGFSETRLVAWEAGGRLSVHCEECFSAAMPDRVPEAVAVFLPEIPPVAFSSYVRVLAWASFAARTDKLRGHDFSTGQLPPTFAGAGGWAAPVVWKTLAEGIDDDRADAVARQDLRKVIEASAFLLRRIEHTRSAYGSTSPDVVERAVGAERYSRDFRVMAPGIELGRIRTWGSAGCTFAMLGEENRTPRDSLAMRNKMEAR